MATVVRMGLADGVRAVVEVPSSGSPLIDGRRAQTLRAAAAATAGA